MTTRVLRIRPLEGYGDMLDADIIQRGGAVVNGLNGNSSFQDLPVGLAALQSAIESLSALTAEALDGSKKVIAQKSKQRETVIKMLRLLGRYVEVHSDGDMARFVSSGFVPASTTKTRPAPLPLPVIRSVKRGPVSGELVVQIQFVPKALTYEIRWGAVVNGGPPDSWASRTVTVTRPPAVFQGLVPGTVYAYQVRAYGRLGYTDWTDSTTCMCV